MDEKVSILICDDHQILSEALSRLIAQEPWLQLAGDPVTSGDEAVAACEATQPDVVLMDVDIEGSFDGIEATRRIKESCPDTKVVVLTGRSAEASLVHAVEAGASGFLDKKDISANLFSVVRTVADGGVAIDAGVLAVLMRAEAQARQDAKDAQLLIDQLTEREIEVLQQLALGKRNADIATELFISESTVQTHIRNVLAKLGVRSKLEAVAFAARHRVVTI